MAIGEPVKRRAYTVEMGGETYPHPVLEDRSVTIYTKVNGVRLVPDEYAPHPDGTVITHNSDNGATVHVVADNPDEAIERAWQALLEWGKEEECADQ